jgi:hypothetical protein
MTDLTQPQSKLVVVVLVVALGLSVYSTATISMTYRRAQSFYLSLVFFLKVKDRKGDRVSKPVYFSPIYIEKSYTFNHVQETSFWKKKQWLFGGLERVSNRCFFKSQP